MWSRKKWSGRILDAINTVPCRSEFDRSIVKEVTKEKVVVLYMSKGFGVDRDLHRREAVSKRGKRYSSS
jgi:hypothetical protein